MGVLHALLNAPVLGHLLLILLPLLPGLSGLTGNGVLPEAGIGPVVQTADCAAGRLPLPRIKLQLGRLLFRQPQALLLDEPSSDVDLETLTWLEGFIGSFSGIVLFISHDEALIEAAANVVLHIEHPREGKPPRCTVRRLDYRTYTGLPSPSGARKSMGVWSRGRVSA